MKRDCHIEEINGDFSVLKQLEQTDANLDELDYLAKRPDSFDDYEKAQFQGMASKLDLHGIEEFINLTFCCQESTVITDFSDLEKIGRRHFLTLRGGISLEEIQGKDFREIVLSLIGYEVGYVTSFGVAYDNGMELKQLYDGRHFPEYRYQDCIMEMKIGSRYTPVDSSGTYLYLPMVQMQIEGAMLRAGIDSNEDMCLRFLESELSTEVNTLLDMEHETLSSLNEMCEAVSKLIPAERDKLGAVVSFAKPEISGQIKNLAKQLEFFDFIPGARNAEDYGRYMIRDSEHFEYDENLAEYYDYEKYGRERMEREHGGFNDRGYVSYHGTLSLDELMAGCQGKRMDMQMGGMN